MFMLLLYFYGIEFAENYMESKLDFWSRFVGRPDGTAWSYTQLYISSLFLT